MNNYSQSAADKSDNCKKSSSNKAESQNKAGSGNSGGGAKESAPKNIKNQLYVLIVSSQVTLLEIVGSLGGGLRPPGGMEAIPTQTKS